MRNYSQGIWWMNVIPDLSTTRIMPSKARITQCLDGVLITYPDGQYMTNVNEYKDFLKSNSDDARRRGLTINHLEPEFVEPHKI